MLAGLLFSTIKMFHMEAVGVHITRQSAEYQLRNTGTSLRKSEEREKEKARF
jgi:hypothetical protein